MTRIRNVSPLGEVANAFTGVVEAGGEVDVPADVAGRAPSTSIDPETGETVTDPGEGLLAQVGCWEAAPEPKTPTKGKTTPEEG